VKDLLKDLRLALLQCAPLPVQAQGNVAANLQRLDAAARAAAGQGAHLLVVPEMFLTGYNIGAQQAHALAEPWDGAIAQAVANLAQDHSIAIAYGYPERGERFEVGQVFNTAQCVDAQGRLLGRYRKTHLFGDLDTAMFQQGAGDEALFTLHGWRVGLLICYDIEFPENARRLALMGADLLVVPTANMQGFDFVAQHMVPTRAYENQVCLAYANYCGAENGLAYGGLSCVAAADGTVLVAAGREPGLLLADLTPSALAHARVLNQHLQVHRSL
jgi:predicted amidohydrolase